MIRIVVIQVQYIAFLVAGYATTEIIRNINLADEPY